MSGSRAQPHSISSWRQWGVECDRWRLQIGVDSGDRRLARLLALAAEPGLHVSEVSVSRPSLADVFLAHTGRALRDS